MLAMVCNSSEEEMMLEEGLWSNVRACRMKGNVGVEHHLSMINYLAWWSQKTLNFSRIDN